VGGQAAELLNGMRDGLQSWFLSLHLEYHCGCAQGGGRGVVVWTAFWMHHNREADMRATYCLLTPCFLLGILDHDDNNNGNIGGDNPLLSPSVFHHVSSCQTYEGRFGTKP
jgi:hypothetical protein